MPVVKTIAVHGTKGISQCIEYTNNTDKTDIDKNIEFENKKSYLDSTFEYAQNLEKTVFRLDDDETVLVSGYECSPDTAPIEFQITRDRYEQVVGKNSSFKRGKKIDPKELKDITKRASKMGISPYQLAKEENKLVDSQSVEAYHLIQSFATDENLDPRLVHQIGLEFCEKLHDYQCVVSTHMNTDNLHNHIVMNAYNLQGNAKYNDCMKTRNYIRSISDEISLKYGIPILIGTSLEQNNLSWYEWKQKQEGKSWKQQMRNDIETMSKVSADWNEFKKNMTEAGYKIRESGKTVTYTMPGSGEFSARDKILGSAYTKASLMEAWGQQNKINQNMGFHEELYHEIKSPEGTVSPKKKFSLFISRYSQSGRRRTDIELIFLAAIKIIQYLRDKYREHDEKKIIKNNPIYQTSATKLKIMEESLHMAMDKGIETKSDLFREINRVGTELSMLKKKQKDREPEVAFATQLLDKLRSYQQLKVIISNIDIKPEQLYLKQYSENDIQRNLASAMPMSASQRKELFLKLEDSEWRLDCKYDELSYKDAKKIIDFISGRNPVQPEHVITLEAFERKRTESKYDAIRDKRNSNTKLKFAGMEASEKQMERIHSLMREHPEYTLQKESISMFEASQIINFYRDNPFSGKLIQLEEQQKMKEALSKSGLSINRDMSTVTQKEYHAVMRYIQSDGREIMPNLLKPAQKIMPSQAAQIKELLELKGENLPFDINELSQADGSMLFDYLLNKNVVPDILQVNEESQLHEDEIKFENEVLNYSVDEQVNIVQYRNVVNELHSYGIDIDNIEMIAEDISSIIREQSDIEEEIRVAGIEYRNLRKLEYNLNLAENKFFTYGPLFQKEQDEELVVQEVSEKIEEDDRLADENRKEEMKNKDKELFEVFSHIYDAVIDR